MNKRNRVAVLFDDNEYKQLLQLAGLVPLSSWIRSQLFPVDDAQRAKDLIPLLKKSIERSNKLIPRGEELPAIATFCHCGTNFPLQSTKLHV